jgi:hypothetical protein
MIRSQGEWLFHEAATTGDWESAAIALRQDVERLAEDKQVLVQALERAWALATVDPLALFAPETTAYLSTPADPQRMAR